MSNTVTIIIPTYNRYDVLVGTIEHLEQSSVLPDEVLIIDQSDDVTISDKIKALCSGRKIKISYFHLDQPSLVKARNFGINNAQGNYIIFMDDDVDVGVDTIEKIKIIFSDDTIALVGGCNKTIVNPHSFFSYFFLHSSFKRRRVGHMAGGIYGNFPIKICEHTVTEWAMGFFFAVRKALVIKWNLRFDEHFQFYSYGEDLDFTYGYCRLAQSEGLVAIYDKKIIVDHKCSQEYRTPNRALTFMCILHRKYIQHKYHKDSFLGKLEFNWSNLGNLMFRIVKKQNVRDYFSAVKFMRKHVKDIEKGIFHYDDFM